MLFVSLRFVRIAALVCRPETLAIIALAAAGAAFAASAHYVAQKQRSFAVSEITIAAGDTIAFGNEDEFLHQIYVASLGFDSAEQHPGETINVTFPRPGRFAVRCHIHPKMLLTVHVK
jgi:plastocyanin